MKSQYSSLVYLHKAPENVKYYPEKIWALTGAICYGLKDGIMPDHSKRPTEKELRKREAMRRSLDGLNFEKVFPGTPESNAIRMIGGTNLIRGFYSNYVESFLKDLESDVSLKDLLILNGAKESDFIAYLEMTNRWKNVFEERCEIADRLFNQI